MPKSVKAIWTNGNLQKYASVALLYFFSREKLATSSLSGTASNAHKEKSVKPALPKDIVCPLIGEYKTCFFFQTKHLIH